MAILHGRLELRLMALLLLLAAITAALITGRTSTTTASDAGPSSPALSAAQKHAAMSALARVTPPPSFHAYERWRAGGSQHSPAVACLPRPSACFASTIPLPTLSGGPARALLARFGLSALALDCPADAAPPPLSMCLGSGKLSGQQVRVILTVVHARSPEAKSGTQVVLFAR
jgi:hypothetical protein